MTQQEKFPVSQITNSDETYPALLKEIHDPPSPLYIRGDITTTQTIPFVAIVGTRKCTSYGKQVTMNLVRDLTRAGVGIASGMALGIDTVAHQTALEENGKTIAVLGSGIDDASIYPRANMRLAKNILENGGAIVSEYEPASPTYPSNFPARNRIIAGLARMTVVIEAPYESGALITARFALEQNRDVGAVPGPLYTKQSEGTNDFIAKGAVCVRSASDILQALGIENAHAGTKQQPIFSSPEEERVYKTLQDTGTPLSIDKIIELTTLLPSQVVSCINSLKLANNVKDVGGERYICNA
ncbi:MAG: DNA-protecting protein DprA [Candidatus Spechtbacteria bacterium]|nr:DNA-protecting protein DprA [Candidatus Spechtbacteria bacterium]